jgi:hypothetical protein
MADCTVTDTVPVANVLVTVLTTAVVERKLVTVSTRVVVCSVSVTVTVDTDVNSSGLGTVKVMADRSVVTTATVEVNVNGTVMVSVTVLVVVQVVREKRRTVLVVQQAHDPHGHGPPWQVAGGGTSTPRHCRHPGGQHGRGAMDGQSVPHEAVINEANEKSKRSRMSSN